MRTSLVIDSLDLPTASPKLLTPKQTAEMLGIAVQTLAIWRCTNRYQLPYVKVGRLVRYRAEQVAEFLHERARGDAEGEHAES